jgi:ADP-ribose pyrophosphatase
VDSQLTETRIDGSVVYDGPFLKVTSDQVSLLERQFRYPLGRVFTEFPAGKIDPGEESLACAKRELQEETGYTATDWQFVCTIHNAIAYSDEHLDLFVARGLTAGPRKLDDGEFLEVFTATVPEMLDMVRCGAITDVKTIIGAFWLEKIASGAWKP